MKQRALLVVVLVGLTILFLYMSLHWYQSYTPPDIRGTMPDQSSDG